MRFVICTLVCVFAFSLHVARAEPLITSLAFRGGPPEVFAAYEATDWAKFVFAYRIAVTGSFLPDELEAQINELITSGSENVDEANELLRSYDIRVRLLGRNSLLAECRPKYSGFGIFKNADQEQVVDISPGNSGVGSKNGHVSRRDSGICVNQTGKRIVPKPRRGDRVQLVVGEEVTVLATARMRAYRPEP